ncbi:HTH-type transcriptional activator CmpR [mine drainage metagenome]|uniref:HTH-type transcriptional activator CmpR n=1 Tax=mine drainage metagenome TaxID=410659 RepID=A0A1J5TCG2_9ZZZZ
MRLTLRQLQIFIAIAKNGSTTAAGEKIALSQSAISASIGELERTLNVLLFDRIGKRLLLNDHGRALLTQALVLVSGAESLEHAYSQDDAPSVLIVGASLTIGNYLLPSLLSQYWRQQGHALGDSLPPLQVHIANTAGIMNKVSNFEVDIGLVEGPCHRADIAVTPWLADELLLVAAPTHPIILEHGKSMIPNERLEKTNWLLREHGSGTREALEQALLPHIAQLRSSLEFNDHEAIKHCAVEGLGIACLSKFVVEDKLETGQLVELNTMFGRLHRRFSLLIHHQKQITAGMQQFIRHAINSDLI